MKKLYHIIKNRLNKFLVSRGFKVGVWSEYSCVQIVALGTGGPVWYYKVRYDDKGGVRVFIGENCLSCGYNRNDTYFTILIKE